MTCKNKNKKVSFKETKICKNNENYKHEFNEKLYDVDDNSNSLGNEELKLLLENFEPKDFGITEKLSESEKKILIKEIYEKKNMSNFILNERKKTNNILIKDNTRNDELKNKEVRKKDKLKNTKNKNNEDFLSNLDGDCYFPNDGYNYEQHLKPLSKNFIEIKTKKEINFFDIKSINEEEKEIVNALNMDNLEELNDNFIYEAQNADNVEKLEIDDKIIWGNPDACILFGNNEYSNNLNKKKSENIIYENITEDNFNSDNYSESNINHTNGCNNNNNEHIIFDKNLNSINQMKNNHYIYESEKEKENKKIENNFDSFKLSDIVKHKLNEGSKNNEKKKIKKKKKLKKYKINSDIFINLNADDKNKILQILNLQEDEIINDEESSFSENSKQSSYDCETILTTKTNTTNHPYKLIIPKEIKENPILNKNIIKTKKKENKSDSLKLERYLILEKIKTTRDKNETPEEKKERKKSVKEAQRLNRKLKKENSIFMKNEKKLMDKNINPFDIRDNLKYIKL